MTDQQRPTGYRGALPERHDALARPWIVTVVAIFVLMFVLAFMGLPSSLFPGASGSPQASGSLSPSAAASASQSAP
jgi:multidrug efflux pump subunit AcrB